MIRQRHQTRWIGLLAALWLVAQLASAFHIGHAETEGFAAQDHSCVICKVAHADDLLLAAPLICLATLAIFLLVAPVIRAQSFGRFLTHQARAPPLFS